MTHERRAGDPEGLDPEAVRELRRRTRRGFTGTMAAFGAGWMGWRWFANSPRDGQINRAMRKALELHERVGRATFRAGSRSPGWPASEARMPIVNGMLGIFNGVEDDWHFRVIGHGGDEKALTFRLDDLRSMGLERVETITELKCVEGWSTPVRWGGYRLRDFAAATGLASRSGARGEPKDAFPYTGLETPDREYLVGLDTPSALHPQTLLCDMMDGKPLSREHGAPLRLFTPVKYGFKSLKRIGLIRFGDARPADTWAARGFDWYAGL